MNIDIWNTMKLSKFVKSLKPLFLNPRIYMYTGKSWRIFIKIWDNKVWLCMQIRKWTWRNCPNILNKNCLYIVTMYLFLIEIDIGLSCSIKSHYGTVIPPVVQQTVDYLRQNGECYLSHIETISERIVSVISVISRLSQTEWWVF